VGRGDVIEPWADAPAWEVVVALPSLGVPTASAFEWYDASGAGPSVGSSRPAGDWGAWLRTCRNDLEPAVFARHPLLARIKERLLGCGAVHAQLSGSGSAVFGLFDGASQAHLAGERLQALGVAARLGRTVGRAAYQRAAFGRDTREAGLPPA
jgi:4-diphosphocytidyl-2-C-methyl-D-erythritol kinase